MDMTRIPIPATGATGDIAILTALERRRAAYEAMASLDADKRFDDGSASSQELRLLREINVAEDILATATATTPAGAQAQLWAGLHGVLNYAEADEDRALLTGDLDYLEALGSRLDRNTRLILSGLRSLQMMEACRAH